MAAEECRYCQCATEEELVWPCSCRQGVHKSCLRRWLQVKQRYWQCELCMEHFMRKVVAEQFYWWQWVLALCAYPLLSLLPLFAAIGVSYPISAAVDRWVLLLSQGASIPYSLTLLFILVFGNIRLYDLLFYAVIPRRLLTSMLMVGLTMMLIQIIGILTIDQVYSVIMWNIVSFAVGGSIMGAVAVIMGTLYCFIWLAMLLKRTLRE